MNLYDFTRPHHSAKRLPPEAVLLEARAQKILQYIAWKSKYLLTQRNRAIEIFLNGCSREAYIPDDPECRITWRTIERFAGQWQIAVTSSAEIRAALARLLAAEYGLVRGQMPNLCAALGTGQPEVQAAYQKLYNEPLEELFLPEPPPETPCEDGSISHESAPPVDWISAADLEMLENAIQRVHLPSGETLFQEGDAGDSMYVIASGRIQVVAQESSGQSCLVAERGRDELVGEMALLTGAPRSATLRALRDTDLYRLPQNAFEQLVAHYPHIALHMTRTLARRLADSARQERRAHPATTIAVFPAGGQADTREFCQALAAALRPHGAVLHLYSALVEQSLEPGAAQAAPNSFEETRLTGWLNDREENHRFILYEADPSPSQWTRRCARQGDRLLLVAQAGLSPQPNAIEAAIFQQGDLCAQIRRELVLLHPDPGTLPTNTRAWLDPRAVQEHHHVVLSSPKHMARLARMLTGKPVCLVLSGGSVRGFTHIGVLRALREQGVEIDIVGGSSAGSIVSGLFAKGLDDREMMVIGKELMKKAGKLFSDYTWPAASITAARRINVLFKELYGDSLIEDLWIKFYCTSSDLSSARLLVHRTGLLRRYIRASTSMPAVFPPIVENNHLLVDGGLMNNLPIDPALEFAPGCTLIAVNVSNDFYPPEKIFNYGDDLPFWQVFNARVNPFAKKMTLPGIGSILLRSIDISSKSSEAPQVAKADLYINPPLGNTSLFDTRGLDRMIEIGYQAALEKLRAWRPA